MTGCNGRDIAWCECGPVRLCSFGDPSVMSPYLWHSQVNACPPAGPSCLTRWDPALSHKHCGSCGSLLEGPCSVCAARGRTPAPWPRVTGGPDYCVACGERTYWGHCGACRGAVEGESRDSWDGGEKESER